MAGVFSKLRRLACGSLALLLSPSVHGDAGDLDPSFGTNGHVVSAQGTLANNAFDTASTSDGGVVTVGFFYTTDGTGANIQLIRRDADGALLGTFGTAGIATHDLSGFDDFGEAIAVQADGKFVIAGNANGQAMLARFNVDGTLDTSFGTNGVAIFPLGEQRSAFKDLKIRADGKIVAVGSAKKADSSNELLVACVTANGTLDTAFGSVGDGTVRLDQGGFSDSFHGVAVGPLGIAAVGDSNLQVIVLRLTDGGLPLAGFGTNGILLPGFGTSAFDVLFDGASLFFCGGGFPTRMAYVCKMDAATGDRAATFGDSSETGVQAFHFQADAEGGESSAFSLLLHGNHLYLAGRFFAPFAFQHDAGMAALDKETGALNMDFADNGVGSYDIGGENNDWRAIARLVQGTVAAIYAAGTARDGTDKVVESIVDELEEMVEPVPKLVLEKNWPIGEDAGEFSYFCGISDFLQCRPLTVLNQGEPGSQLVISDFSGNPTQVRVDLPEGSISLGFGESISPDVLTLFEGYQDVEFSVVSNDPEQPVITQIVPFGVLHGDYVDYTDPRLHSNADLAPEAAPMNDDVENEIKWTFRIDGSKSYYDPTRTGPNLPEIDYDSESGIIRICHHWDPDSGAKAEPRVKIDGGDPIPLSADSPGVTLTEKPEQAEPGERFWQWTIDVEAATGAKPTKSLIVYVEASGATE